MIEFVQRIGTTFVFMQWLSFDNLSVHYDRTLNEDKNLQLTHHATIV